MTKKKYKLNKDDFAMACHKGRFSTIKDMLEAGFYIGGEDGRLGVTKCIVNGFIECLDLFKQYNYKFTQGNLISSSYQNNPKIIEFLVNAGLDINDYDQKNRIFTNCCKFGYLENAKYLLSIGADAQADYNNPLLLACSNGHFKMVQFLLDNGANANVDQGEALVETLLSDKFNNDIIKVLVKNGALTDVTNNKFLIFAGKFDRLEAVQFFVIDCNVDPTILLTQPSISQNVINWVQKYFATKTLNNKLLSELPEHSIVKSKRTKL